MSHGDDFGSPYGGRGGDYDYGDAPARGRGTRTRLHDDDTFSGSRRPRPAASPRSLMTVVGVVVLLIAAIAFANRGGSSDDAAPKSRPDPTAASGDHPARTGSAGIPAGFPKSKRGAQSAAANYAVALGSDGMFNAGQRHTIVSAVGDSSTVDKLQQAFDSDYSESFNKRLGLSKDGKAPAGQTFVSRTIPIGTKAVSYKGGDAAVEVWCNGLFGLTGERSDRPVTNSWFTVTVKLRWDHSDWKVLDTSQKKGPTPVTGDNPVSGSQEIGDAVKGYGGFSYAR